MTGRQVMMWRVACSRSAGWSAFLGGLPALLIGAKVAESGHRILGVTLVVAGLAYYVVARTIAPSMIRCPWCHADFSDLLRSSNPGGLDRILCCPFCAMMLDEPAPRAGKPRPKLKDRQDEDF